MDALNTIYCNLLKEKGYHHTLKSGIKSTVLVLSPFKNYIRYSHYGSSSLKLNKSNLKWIIKEIFEMTPEEFIKVYKAED